MIPRWWTCKKYTGHGKCRHVRCFPWVRVIDAFGAAIFIIGFVAAYKTDNWMAALWCAIAAIYWTAYVGVSAALRRYQLW